MEEFVTLAWPKIRPFAVLDGNSLFKPPAVDDNEEVADLQDEEQAEEQEEDIGLYHFSCYRFCYTTSNTNLQFPISGILILCLNFFGQLFNQ